MNPEQRLQLIRDAFKIIEPLAWLEDATTAEKRAYDALQRAEKAVIKLATKRHMAEHY